MFHPVPGPTAGIPCSWPPCWACWPSDSPWWRCSAPDLLSIFEHHEQVVRVDGRPRLDEHVRHARVA